MAAVFCKPQAITYETSSTITVAEPKNMTNDEPGMVYRSPNLSGVYLVFKLTGKPIDTIALVGNNLQSTATVRVRMGATVAELNGVAAFDHTYKAWDGIAPLDDVISMFLLDSPVSHQYIRLDFTDATNPDGYIQCCRLVVGMRVTNVGIDIDHEEEIDDTSNIVDEFGSLTIENYRVRSKHKIVVSGIKDADYYTNWQPFIVSTGMSKFFLFVEKDDDQFTQRKTLYVRSSANPKRTDRGSNNNTVEFQVTTYK